MKSYYIMYHISEGDIFSWIMQPKTCIADLTLNISLYNLNVSQSPENMVILT